MTDPPDTSCPVCEMPIMVVGEKIYDFFTNQDHRCERSAITNCVIEEESDRSLGPPPHPLSLSTTEVSFQQQGQNQTYSSAASSGIYYEGLDWWRIYNNSLVRSYLSQPYDTLVTPDHRALTSQGKAVLERVLCPKGPSVLSTIELFYGSIPDKAKNELSTACGWQ